MKVRLLTIVATTQPTVRFGIHDAMARVSRPRMRYSSPAAWKGVVSRMTTIMKIVYPRHRTSSGGAATYSATTMTTQMGTVTARQRANQPHRNPPATELSHFGRCPQTAHCVSKATGIAAAMLRLFTVNSIGVILTSSSEGALPVCAASVMATICWGSRTKPITPSTTCTTTHSAPAIRMASKGLNQRLRRVR